jgi:hypothetical protein
VPSHSGKKTRPQVRTRVMNPTWTNCQQRVYFFTVMITGCLAPGSPLPHHFFSASVTSDSLNKKKTPVIINYLGRKVTHAPGHWLVTIQIRVKKPTQKNLLVSISKNPPKGSHLRF